MLTPSLGLRAVHHQIQGHVESDVAYLLPRLHGLNSTLCGSGHSLTPTKGLCKFRDALEEFSALYDKYLVSNNQSMASTQSVPHSESSFSRLVTKLA